MGYDFIVEYKQGKEYKVVDALSWKMKPLKEGTVSTIIFSSNTLLVRLRPSYNQDSKLQTLFMEVEEGELSHTHFSIKNGLLL